MSNSIPEIHGSVILIGNGPSSAMFELGDQIDQFDEVIRFNRFKINGFEKNLGTKVTFWATFGRGERPQETDPPKKVILTHEGARIKDIENHDVFRIPYHYHQEKRKIIQDIVKSKGRNEVPILPSSGFLTTCWLLEKVGVQQVTLLGFDHFSKEQSSQHHYWLKQSFGKPQEHDGEVEHLLLSEFGSRVMYLSGEDKNEKQKYEGLYSDPKTKNRYGRTNHGKHAIPYVLESGCKSLLDVGCGHNNFVNNLKIQSPEIKGVGVDFAGEWADITCCATKMPFVDKEFDMLTAFDMMEHLTPVQVDSVLKEMNRVSKNFIFSISYVPSVWKWQGKTLHPTVRSEEWWVDRIKKHGGKNIIKKRNYITGNW